MNLTNLKIEFESVENNRGSINEGYIWPLYIPMMSTEVSVGERRISASWTPELAQDVQAFYNIDAEAELTTLLSEQLASELDNSIVQNILRSRYTITQTINPNYFGRIEVNLPSPVTTGLIFSGHTVLSLTGCTA